jgi:hypothetical protein
MDSIPYKPESGKQFSTAEVQAQPEISRSLVEQILTSNPAAAAYKVAIGSVWIWIHGALISKRGQRRRVLEAFLDAPNNRLTSMELVLIANQYGARVLELRAAGFPLPNMPAADGSTYFELMVTEQQVREIRAALACADVLKPEKRKGVKSVAAESVTPVPPQANAAGQFGFGFKPVIDASSFLDMERGVQK